MEIGGPHPTNTDGENLRACEVHVGCSDFGNANAPHHPRRAYARRADNLPWGMVEKAEAGRQASGRFIVQFELRFENLAVGNFSETV